MASVLQTELCSYIHVATEQLSTILSVDKINHEWHSPQVGIIGYHFVALEEAVQRKHSKKLERKAFSAFQCSNIHQVIRYIFIIM